MIFFGEMELLSMKKKLILLLFLHTLTCESSSSIVNGTDRLSLLAFRGGISEDPLRVFNSWNDSLHFCEWMGVKCSHHRHHGRRVVTALNLAGFGLVGNISSHIANLTFLTAIDLSNNGFIGDIPHEVGRLFRLRYLNLSFNSFRGEIPINLINCTGLRAIDVTRNYAIRGRIPAELGTLSRLNVLNLGGNSLRGSIPSSFANLSSLLHLRVAQNGLGGSIPNELGQLQRLTTLLLNENKLSGVIPPSLYNLSLATTFNVMGNRLRGALSRNMGLALPYLEYLYMGANAFTGPIPPSLSNASSLRMLDLSNNSFTGPLPANIGRLKDLILLNVEANQLGSGGVNDDDLSFLTSLTNCSRLQMLSFGVNKLSGMLPSSIANLSTQLTQLWLADNQISGRIPQGIESLTNLTGLIMAGNRLVGPIPLGIGKLRKLQKLLLHWNRLTGEIPTSLGNATYLSELYLNSNELQGRIPYLTLSKFQTIEELELSMNNFVGDIPKQLVNLSFTLSYLDLSQNSFTGSLPLEVGSMENLMGLGISDNRLSGEIPTTLGNCRSMTELYMQGNFFRGAIPSSLKNLRAIEYLDLSRNNLSDRIPEYLGRFEFLQYLNLSFNSLEGELPKGTIFKNMSAFSVVGNKNLCGGIPLLHLPTCPNKTLKKSGNSARPKWIIPAITVGVSFVLLTCLCASLYCLRKSRKKSCSAAAAAAASDEDLLLRVSYLELLEATDGFSSANLIGVGNYGSVYRGVLDRTKMIIAVKVLNLQQKGAVKSFVAECNALRQIRHRNLVKILTACSSIDFQGNDFKALVFEYMPNGSLEKWLHPAAPSVNGEHQLRKLNLIERLNIAIDVASAMEYLHHHGHAPVIHRDLKPSNVLLDDDMTAHVGDFGLAKLLPAVINDSSRSQTSSLGIRGSVGYVAPEYGFGGKASTQGDVYSYGILLLETFTGKQPTDEMFKEGLSLHQLAKEALPERVMGIADPQLLSEDDDAFDDIVLLQISSSALRRSKLHECLASVIRIGVVCSAESQRERMDMKEVVREMQVIRDVFLGTGIHGETPNRAELLGEGSSSYLSNY